METPRSELQALGAGYEVHEPHTTRVTDSHKTHTPSNTQHIPTTHQHHDIQVLKQPQVWGNPPQQAHLSETTHPSKHPPDPRPLAQHAFWDITSPDTHTIPTAWQPSNLWHTTHRVSAGCLHGTVTDQQTPLWPPTVSDDTDTTNISPPPPLTTYTHKNTHTHTLKREKELSSFHPPSLSMSWLLGHARPALGLWFQNRAELVDAIS